MTNYSHEKIIRKLAATGGILTMCLICVELKKDNLTAAEARRNLGEMITVIEKDHRLEVLHRIWEKEDAERAATDDDRFCVGSD